MESTFAKKETPTETFARENGMGDGLDLTRARAAAGAAQETNRPWKECFKRLINLEKAGRIGLREIEYLAQKGVGLC
jgi:hypothetical protein